MNQAETKRILIAEDNQVMADVVRFNLERSGYEVTIAATGEEAWEILQDDQFDLLITDFQMPYMNGDELCRRIKEGENHSHMPVIMCSAKGFELDQNQLYQELNVVELIFKPFSPTQLKKIVAEVLEKTVVSVT